MPRIVRCGLIQASNAVPPTDKQTTLEAIKKAMIDKHLPLIEDAGKQGVQILCLQELFYGPYFCAEQDTSWYDADRARPRRADDQADAGARQEAPDGDGRAGLRRGA